MTETKKIPLYTLLATYPNTKALKDGSLTSPLIDFKFADVEVANTAFKRLVRENEFDAGELAIVTYLQAKIAGKPYDLLPIVVVGRGQHHTIVYNPEHGTLKPDELNGKRVGVRSFTQTTGAWVRGHLVEEHGMDTSKVHWITFEAPHIAEYKDPAWVERAPEGKQLLQMMKDGELDAMIGGDKLPDPSFKRVVADHEDAGNRWAEAHHGIPINHMIVVKQPLLQEHPELAPELFRLFKESTARAAASGVDTRAYAFGVEACRGPLEAIIGYAVEQGLIPRKIEVDDLFTDVARNLA